MNLRCSKSKAFRIIICSVLFCCSRDCIMMLGNSQCVFQARSEQSQGTPTHQKFYLTCSLSGYAMLLKLFNFSISGLHITKVSVVVQYCTNIIRYDSYQEISTKHSNVSLESWAACKISSPVSIC